MAPVGGLAPASQEGCQSLRHGVPVSRQLSAESPGYESVKQTSNSFRMALIRLVQTA